MDHETTQGTGEVVGEAELPTGEKDGTQLKNDKKVPQKLSTADQSEEKAVEAEYNELVQAAGDQLDVEEAKVEKTVPKKTKKPSVPINRNNSDNWDEDLIPQELIDQIYAEMEGWSDENEMYTTADEEEESELEDELDGKKRKQDGMTDEPSTVNVKARKSLVNVDKAISLKLLQQMKNSQLRSLIKKTNAEILYIQTENFVLQRTMEEMEKREKAIDNFIPFEYEYQVVDGKNTRDICESDSSEDEINVTGIYKSINSSENLAPHNFDVMRHKYGKLAIGENEEPEIFYLPGEAPTTGDNELTACKAILEAQMGDAKVVQMLEAEENNVDPDEDPEFPGFKPSKAKKLPISEKLKYAVQEEILLRKDLYDAETRAIVAENQIQVYVDLHMDSVELLKKLKYEFMEMLKTAYHKLTGRLRAEKILQFRVRIRDRILAEETKISLTVMEFGKAKRSVDGQLKANRDLGDSIDFIDFEELRIGNAEMQLDIEKKHQYLKELKVITAACYQVLKEQREELDRSMKEHKKINDEMNLRLVVLESFRNDFKRYSAIMTDLTERNAFLRKRLRTFRAPHTMEYIRQRAVEYELMEDVEVLQKKVKSMDQALLKTQSDYQKYLKQFPKDTLVGIDHNHWLDEIKREVAEKNLMALMDDEDIRKGQEIVARQTVDIGISGIPIPQGLKKSYTKSVAKRTGITALLLAPRRERRSARKELSRMSFEDEDARINTDNFSATAISALAQKK